MCAVLRGKQLPETCQMNVTLIIFFTDTVRFMCYLSVDSNVAERQEGENKMAQCH